MVRVEIKKPINVKSGAAAFLAFAYSLENVAKVKSLPSRWYVPATKEWEVPASDLDKVVQLFNDSGITLVGPAVTKGPVKYVSSAMPEEFNFKTTPFNHQIEAFNYAKSVDKFLLGDEQGLGKTKQSIDIAVSRRHLMKYTLIVCGVNSVKYNWVKEVATHSSEKAYVLGARTDAKGRTRDGGIKERIADLENGVDAFFLITNIETLRNKDVQAMLERMTTSGEVGMVIIDEVHKCKNAQSQQGKAIACLKSRYKLALTGTPIMNSPLDVYNVMKWLEVERNSFYAFRSRYCTMGGYGGYEVVGYKNMDELRNRFSRVMLRRKKDEVLNLPPKIRSVEYVDMTDGQAKLYRDVQRMLRDSLKEIELSDNPLAMLIRLRQVTAHTSILSDTVKESAKLDRLKEIVEELTDSGKKAVIFSNWEEVTSIVRDELKQYNPAYITGKVADRQTQVETFQTDANCKVIIGTIGAMGTGLTLTAATTVIFLDKPWNMANVEQAEDRAHRIGTTGTVNVITLVCNGTIDQHIERIIETKSIIADALTDGKLEKLDALSIVKEILEEEY